MVKRAAVVPGKSIVDASLTDSSGKPRGRKKYEIAQDRQENDRSGLEQERHT